MQDDKKVTRRGFFQGAAKVAGAALAVGVIPIRVAHAQTKASKEAMKYQDKPKDGQRCDQCVYFQPPRACGLVEGDIAPEGWCVAYNKKS